MSKPEKVSIKDKASVLVVVFEKQFLLFLETELCFGIEFKKIVFVLKSPKNTFC